jgi:hypothetical protein
MSAAVLVGLLRAPGCGALLHSAGAALMQGLRHFFFPSLSSLSLHFPQFSIENTDAHMHSFLFFQVFKARILLWV